MNLYQRANQILVSARLRKSIISGGNKEFMRAYRKGDISKEESFTYELGKNRKNF